MDKNVEIAEVLKRKPAPLFSGAALKYLAALTMLTDHAAVALLETRYAADGTLVYRTSLELFTLCRWMRHIGRFAFPVFCFFIAEGYCRTRSRWKYLLNLMLFGVISQVPFRQALFTGMETSSRYYLNVFFTLALGLLCVWALDGLVLRKYSRGPAFMESWPAVIRAASAGGCIAAACYAAYYFHTDYRYGGIIVILVFFLLREYPVPACCAAYIALCLYNHNEVWSLPAFVMLTMYNGRRGRQNKYFFYVFYPAHIALLWLLKSIL